MCVFCFFGGTPLQRNLERLPPVPLQRRAGYGACPVRSTLHWASFLQQVSRRTIVWGATSHKRLEYLSSTVSARMHEHRSTQFLMLNQVPSLTEPGTFERYILRSREGICFSTEVLSRAVKNKWPLVARLSTQRCMKGTDAERSRSWRCTQRSLMWK